MKMSGGRTDASTSTDDLKGRPLCVFYFTHPFAVISPEPPTTLLFTPPPPAHSAPAQPAENMRPHHTASPAAAPAPHALAHLYLDCGWSSAHPSKVLRRTLPPLRLPTPRDLSMYDSSDDVWSIKCSEKFSLPPIELPMKVSDYGSASPSCCRSIPAPALAPTITPDLRRVVAWNGRRAAQAHGARTRPKVWSRGGVRKDTPRAALARLLRRAVTVTGSGGGCAGGLHAALVTIRSAWATPAPITRERSLLNTPTAGSTESRQWPPEPSDCEMGRRDNSAGLPRRRYSVPEIVMRKYNLSRQLEGENTEVCDTATCPPSASPPRWPCGVGAGAGREVMRRSALLRRLWGRPLATACPYCEPRPCPSRSLDNSHLELRSTAQAAATAAATWSSLTPSTAPEYCNGSVSGCAGSPPDILEIVVSASSPATITSPSSSISEQVTVAACGPRLVDPVPTPDLDKYVSDVLLASLNSLSDLLENMSASITSNGRMSVVEKEIKVRLRNTATSTSTVSSSYNERTVIRIEEPAERDRGSCEPAPVPPPAARDRIQQLFSDETRELRQLASPRPLEHDIHGRTTDVNLWRAVGSYSSEVPSDSIHWDTGGGGGSPSTSLVDSLDDPGSPRPKHIAPPPPPPDNPRTPQMQSREKSEAFFVAIEDGKCDESGMVGSGVAGLMPERLKRRLSRRHRRRELRAHTARRAREDAPREQCAHVEEVYISNPCKERTRNRVELRDTSFRVTPVVDRPRVSCGKPSLSSHDRRRATVPGAPAGHGAPPAGRTPRRLYRKSEIHDDGGCVEILEIVEYGSGSRSSAGTVSDAEAAETRARRSRIPVPVPGRRYGCGANPPRPEPVPPPPPPSLERRIRCDSVRFERSFDAIPEERCGIDSPRVEAPALSPVPAPPRPAPVQLAPRRRPLVAPAGIPLACALPPRPHRTAPAAHVPVSVE